MKFSYSDEKTIAERVALGRSSKWPPAGSIVAFPAGWVPANFYDHMTRVCSNTLSKKLSEGYEKGPLYLYHDEAGTVISTILRLNNPMARKEILPFRATTNYHNIPNLEMKALDPPRPLYNLHLLAAEPDRAVVLVEGEKAADAAGQRFPDHVATTWSGGAQGLSKADWRPLIGRDVTIWPDNDDTGLGAAEKIGALLRDIGAASVRVVLVPSEFPAKWDIADPLPELSCG